jgi:hypothetical protein
VEVCPWNLLEQSNTFSNAIWDKSNATLTSGQSGYDATSNAWKFESSVGTSTYIAQSSFSILRTQSIYAKAGTTSKFSIIVGGYGNGMQFDLSNGTIVDNSNSAYFSGSITSVGNGWYYIVVTVQATAPTYGFLIAPQLLNGGGISVGDYIFIQNAQLNIGSTAKPYFPTTDRLNVPRLTYQNGGGGCPSLLLEKQSTNNFLYSEQFDQADWVKISPTTITANTTTSPDGTTNADSLNSTTSTEAIYQVSASGTITFSVYAKAGTTTSLQLASTTSFNGRGADFNLSNGTASAVYQIGSGDADINGGTSSIVNVGNGWYRCIISGLVLTASRAITIANNNGNASYIWGAQLE